MLTSLLGIGLMIFHGRKLEWRHLDYHVFAHLP